MFSRQGPLGTSTSLWESAGPAEVNHSYNGAVEASQLAHRLGVVTPRVLQISLTSCFSACFVRLTWLINC